MTVAFVKSKKIRKDKSDRATKEKVLDPKTLLILEKLKKRNILFDLEGCISSGKEANIYKGKIKKALHCKFIKKKDVLMEEASANGGNENTQNVENVAIKIFRTSILEFKNRHIYITSEKRFENFRISNPRKLIKAWAEKEVRNLTRLNNNDIPSPCPIYLKRNIIIMKLIGNDNYVAPQLKDLQEADFYKIYHEVVELISKMYRNAKLIHCDLSEYNLLYYEEKVFVIDVGQGVDVTHAYADVFLINDISNVSKFFERKCVTIENIKTVFERITGREMHFDIKGTEINKLGFDTGRFLELYDNLKNNIAKDEIVEEEYHIEKKIKKHGNADDGKFTKNKFLEKEEKLERRKKFKNERKMKRMAKDKKTKVVKKNVKRKKHMPAKK